MKLTMIYNTINNKATSGCSRLYELKPLITIHFVCVIYFGRGGLQICSSYAVYRRLVHEPGFMAVLRKLVAPKRLSFISDINN